VYVQLYVSSTIAYSSKLMTTVSKLPPNSRPAVAGAYRACSSLCMRIHKISVVLVQHVTQATYVQSAHSQCMLAAMQYMKVTAQAAVPKVQRIDVYCGV
jgi:hypothetical protein